MLLLLLPLPITLSARARGFVFVKFNNMCDATRAADGDAAAAGETSTGLDSVQPGGEDPLAWLNFSAFNATASSDAGGDIDDGDSDDAGGGTSVDGDDGF